MAPQKEPGKYFLLAVSTATALCLLALFMLTIKQDVFFSGDGGLKFLMVKQIAKGGSFSVLHLTAPPWVANIWSLSYYPFKEPFIYDSYLGKMVSFPPAFQRINAFLYNRFGAVGLYILTCFSLVILWGWFLILLQKIKIKTALISAGFLVLAVCSPLTFYGAIYWEHSLAVLLMFSAIVYTVTRPANILTSVFLGLLAGLSVWLRPEMLVLNFLFLLINISTDTGKSKRAGIAFLSSSLLAIGAFFIFNNNNYGNIFGAHGYQLTGTSGYRYFADKIIFFSHLNLKLVVYFPFILFVFLLLFKKIITKKFLNDPVTRLCVITIAFLAIVPFVLPNAGGKQWGPRYLLPAVPLTVVTLVLATAKKQFEYFGRWLPAIFLLLLVYGFYLNGYLAYRTLANDYASRVRPGLHFLQRDTCSVIVVQNQFISQEFASLFEQKKIFLAEDQQAFTLLLPQLTKQFYSNIIYVAHDNNFEMLPTNLLTDSKKLLLIGDYYFARYHIR